MFKRFLVPFIGFALFFLIWEIVARSFNHMLFILPPPSKILATLFSAKKCLVTHTFCTFKEMIGGFFLALAVAFPLAFCMLEFKGARATLQPFFIVIQCLPMFTLAPIMVIFFGWGYTAIVVPTALMIFFPLTLNIYQGLRSTPDEFLEFFTINQATRLQTFFKLRLPFALPHIFAGFRIAAAIAGIGAIAGEWAGAQNGLGVLMLESRRNADLELTFAALFCLTTMSFGFYTATIALEKSSWIPKRRPKQPRRRYFTKIFYSLSIVFVILFITPGCLKKETTPKPPYRLTLDWLPNANHIPLYVGMEKGFFADENASFTIQKMHEEGNGIAYLNAKETDLLVNHLPGTLRATVRGADVAIVGLLIKEPLRGLIYHANLPVSSPSDLSGYRLGYCVGGPNTDFLDSLLKHGHIEPSAKRNVSVDIVSAMGTHSVDMVYGGFWNIEPFQWAAFGMATKHFPIQAFKIPTYYEMIVLAQRNTLFATPFFQKRFSSALQKSIDYCKAHPEEAFAIYLRHNPDKRERTIAWEKKSWQATLPLLAKDQTIDREVIKVFCDYLTKNSIVKEKIDFESLILE